MHKIFATSACLVLILSLTACSSAVSTEESPAAQWSNVTESSELFELSELSELSESSETSEASETSASPSWTNTTEESEKAPDPIPVFVLQPTIEETVLFEQDGIRITAKDLTYKNSRAVLRLLLENETAKELSFYSNTLAYSCNSVNGHMFSYGYINEDVAAGSSMETTIYIPGDELSLYRITDIADLELGFKITGEDNFELETGPCPLQTSLSDSYDYSIVSFQEGIQEPRNLYDYGYQIISQAAEEIYNQLDLLIRAESILTTEDGETVINLEVENQGTEMKNLTLGDISVNGIIVESGNWTSQTINPGKTGSLNLVINNLLDQSVWEATGIDTFSSIAFGLTQKDAQFNTIADQEYISLTLASDAGFTPGTEIYRDDYIAVYKQGILPDESEYDDDYHIILVYENLTDQELTITSPYDGFSINGSSEAQASTPWIALPAESFLLDDMRVYSYSFEDIGIANWDDVSEATLTIEIKNTDSFNTLEETTLQILP